MAQLPIIEIRRKAYYHDARLGELRATSNPHDRIQLGPQEFPTLAARDAWLNEHFGPGCHQGREFLEVSVEVSYLLVNVEVN